MAALRDSPFWADYPRTGTLMEIHRETDGIPWRVTLQGDAEHGWTRVVAIEIGLPDPGRPRPVPNPTQGREVSMPALPAVTPSIVATIGRQADTVLRDVEATRLVLAATRVSDDPAPVTLSAATQQLSRLVDDDSHYTRVATLYEHLVGIGQRDATATVARAFGVGRSTAARWIQTARRKGLLGPARRGVAGVAEKPTKKPTRTRSTTSSTRRGGRT